MNRPVHFEILADDPGKIADFYQKVLDWKVATWQGPQTYWLVTTGPEGTSGINGGIMKRHFAQAVINTVAVQSLDETIKKIETEGGKKVHGPNEIPGIGLHAYCADPEGNLFGILQPSTR
jgi:predicted enzyme related to lactoylglutathione lyase